MKPASGVNPSESLFYIPRGSKLAGQNNSRPVGKRATRFYLGRKSKATK